MRVFPMNCSGLLLALSISFPSLSVADEVRVAVASNFAPVLEKLAAAFEQQSGHSISIISGASGQHYTQIINGAPYDVFLSADDERPALLLQQGRGIDNSVFTYAIGQLVLWSADAQLVDAEGAVLQAGKFDHIALANPKLAPYGAAAEQVLRDLDVWDALQRKIVMGENITQTLQFVATGNAELGFIARSQWLETDAEHKGSVWEIPLALYKPIVQQGVLLRETAAATELKNFLQGESARAVIEDAGYAVP